MMKVALLVSTAFLAMAAEPATYKGWPSYGGTPDQIRYSSLKQINRTNVGKMKLAWKYDTGDAFSGSEMQCQPIVQHGVMYATTPKLRVIALDAATGKELWSYTPPEAVGGQRHWRNRGLMYWESPSGEKRVYLAAQNNFYAIDAKTGKLAASFGKSGVIDLRENLGRPAETLTLTVTTPGAVYKDLLILGSLTGEDLPSPPGDIRAYDARTGALKWSFHSIPHPGEKGYDTWPKDAWKTIGGANSWPGMALDEKRGIVYVPTGSAAFDFYGANRIGDDLYANCLIALEAATGKRLWHFQFVKHDVWDRDLPSPPSLVTVKRNGKLVDAVAQTTKTGHVFVFDRVTGESLFPLQQMSVSTRGVDGEVLSATQVLPLEPPALARQRMTETDLTDRAKATMTDRFRKLRNEGPYTPPGPEGSLMNPGYDGGAEWGGSSFDPETNWLYVNVNEMPSIIRLVPRGEKKARTTGKALYGRYCASCHRPDLGGAGDFPSLKGLAARMTEADAMKVVHDGRGRMTGFAHLGDKAIAAIAGFVMTGDAKEVQLDPVQLTEVEVKYALDGYQWLMDAEGFPAITPPWGSMVAVNLNTGKIEWKVPLGEYPKLAEQGMKDTGSQNYGGPIATAGGLLFIGAGCFDKKFRVFDKQNGKLLWETTLEASANATPAMFEAGGKQFVVIGAGGGKFGASSGGTYYAFALEE